MIPVSVSGLLISEETEERMKEIDPRDPLLHWNMFDTMVKYYNPDGNLPQYILGKADEDDYTGFPKIIMYFAGDEVFAGIAPDYEKSFIRCGVKDYQIKIKEGMFHAWPVFTFTKEGRDGEQEIIDDIKQFFGMQKNGERLHMNQYTPEKLVAVSRYQNFFPTLDETVRRDVYARIAELMDEEKEYCDKGNYKHMAQILTSVALYEALQKHGKSEEEAYKIVSEEMWAFLDPSGMQKLAGKSFFMPLMKKIVPFGFKKGSGVGWRYTWHKDDPKDRFHFECNECIYAKILGKRNLMKLGAMCCHADIINYGSLPYTDFIRTKTLCQGGDKCDFLFVRHATDAGDGWERSESI